MYVERVLSAHAVLSDVHCRMSHLHDHGFMECCQRKLASDVVKLYNAVPLATTMVLDGSVSIFAKRRSFRKRPSASRQKTSPSYYVLNTAVMPKKFYSHGLSC